MMFKLPGGTPTAASYEFTNEDHTLGNALRHMIMKKQDYLFPIFLFVLTYMNSPDVEFCGYSIPHPAEPKMHLRIQTYGKYLRNIIFT
jgi:DNA-directed RNA polymerases I and III subunit RPAC2